MFPNDRTFIIAEIGPNHNGDVEIAKKLIDVAAEAGADCAKFQIKTPHMCLPPELWDVERDTPWGRMKYIEYRQKIELSPKDLIAVRQHCSKRGILFSASAWDVNAAGKFHGLDPSFIKVASASVTNIELLKYITKLHKPVVMSTAMCSLREIHEAVNILASVPELALLVCTATYPALPEMLNLERLNTLRMEFPTCKIGYSGHETGLWTTLCAVAMGAQIIERHITLDRSMVGSDHSASVEPQGFKKLVAEIRNFEKARGSGEIRVLDCEQGSIARLRCNSLTGATQLCEK